jgi:hypothetical protein
MDVDMGVMVVTGAAAVFLGCTLIGGPMALADWVQRQRQAVIDRQITLTDTLDARFGTLVAPVVTKSLFGSWEVRIDVPILASATLSGIIAVTDAVFAGVEGTPPMRYRLDLRVTPAPQRVAPDPPVRRPAKHWPGRPAAA